MTKLVTNTLNIHINIFPIMIKNLLLGKPVLTELQFIKQKLSKVSHFGAVNVRIAVWCGESAENMSKGTNSNKP